MRSAIAVSIDRVLYLSTVLILLMTGFHNAHAIADGSSAIVLNKSNVWTDEWRYEFYSRDQGSRIMPLSWMVALKQASGEPFMADSLTRYGYLRNEKSIPSGLPVGFTVATSSTGEMIGMTCAACHTRQITMKGKKYRIDGGPAIVDFQQFLGDLDQAVGTVVTDPAVLGEFSRAVLGASASDENVAALRKAVEDWYHPFDTLIKRALADPPWGPGRLDAVSMIFNRLTGLDIGPEPTYVIEGNIKPANAPVRYPFLWNAPRQDKTQWPGFANNGNSILGLARNLGEVTGVFSIFHPKKDSGSLLGIDYVSVNSANLHGLRSLEEMIDKIGPPKWPLSIDKQLAAEGAKLFKDNCAKGCHEIKDGAFRSIIRKSWLTPILNVGTDTREWSILERNVDPGVLAGSSILGLDESLQNPEAPIKILGNSVIGTIIQHTIPLTERFNQGEQMKLSGSVFTADTKDLKDAFNYTSPGAPTKGSYESRVLQGVWATAPYLHNGSVPTLAELLKPAAERVAAFKIGPNYDPDQLGLAVEQSAFQRTLVTTDCKELDSGNSRCGHEGPRFGTNLSAHKKKALLEYLKTL